VVNTTRKEQSVNQFAELTRKTRRERHVSLREIARRLKVTPAYVSEVERGRKSPPSIEVVKEWALALGLDPDKLLSVALSSKRSIDLGVENETSSDQKKRAAVLLARRWNEMDDSDYENLIWHLEGKGKMSD
jgi:transcriptional regulator with XRE-family HTH domain